MPPAVDLGREEDDLDEEEGVQQHRNLFLWGGLRRVDNAAEKTVEGGGGGPVCGDLPCGGPALVPPLNADRPRYSVERVRDRSRTFRSIF